jgi:hypothetical protein
MCVEVSLFDHRWDCFLGAVVLFPVYALQATCLTYFETSLGLLPDIVNVSVHCYCIRRTQFSGNVSSVWLL